MTVLSTRPAPPATSSRPSAPQTPPAPQAPVPSRIWIPVVAVLGYVAFLLAGFAASLGDSRALPVYAFLGLLLFLFQAALVRARSFWSLVWVGLSSIFALAFAGDLVFNQTPGWHFTRDPRTYLVMTAVLFATFLVTAVRDRRRVAGEMAQHSPFAASNLAAFFGELAILGYIAWGILSGLQVSGRTYLVVDLNRLLGWHLPDGLRTLPAFCLAIALAATAVALLALGMAAALSAAGGPLAPRAGAGDGQAVVARWWTTLRRISFATFDEVLRALRPVEAPVIWIGTGLCLAWLAEQIASYLQPSSVPAAQVLDLFNPFSARSLARYPQGLLSLGLGLLAVATVVLSVALTEHDSAVLGRALRLLERGGQAAALSLAFFTLSLATLNALLIYVKVTRVEPFQVSAVTLLALLAAGTLALWSRWHARRR